MEVDDTGPLDDQPANPARIEPPSTRHAWLIERLLDARWWLLGVGLLLAAISFPLAQRIEFNRSIENMFAADDPVVPPYRRLKETFGGNEIVLCVVRIPDLLAADGSGIARLATLGDTLRGVPGVRDVLTLDRPIGPAIVGADGLAARLRDVFAGYTHSTDGRMAAAVCLLEPEETASPSDAAHRPPPRTETIARLRAIMESPPAGLPAGMIAGEPVMVVEGFRSLESDGRLLATWSTLLVGIVIVVCFRSLRWVAIPLAVVQLSLWLTYGLLVWGGFRMTLVSGMLSAIVTVVGIATAVHVLIAFREGRAAGLSTRAALAAAAGRMAAPVIWSLVTDAAGFGSLLVSAVGPVRDFGLMTLVGSLLVLPCLVLLVPGLAMAGRWDSTPRQAWGERGLGAVLDWTSWLVERYPWRLLAAISILAVVSIAGLRRLEVETDFTRNFRAGSELVRSYETIESEFGGAGVLDVILPAPPQLTWDYVKRVAALEERLRVEVQVADEQGQPRPGLTKVLSAADALRAAMPVDPDKLPFAAARNLAVGAAWQTMKARMPAFAATLYAPATESGSWLRVMLRARERQSAAEKTRLIEQVQRIVDEELRADEWRPLSSKQTAAVTGYYVLLTKLIASTVRDQWLSFGLATLGVFVSLLGALRGLRLSLIALAPNALPIVTVLGGLGWLGLKLNLGAAMIAAVSMGLSVDSSIHYLMAFQRRRNAGLAIGAALRATQQEVGRAVVFSTLALVVGFLVLCRSEFMPTVYFGLLVSLAMLGGLLGNLVLLPALLRVAPLGKLMVAARTAAH
jgi:hypothetical protein